MLTLQFDGLFRGAPQDLHLRDDAAAELEKAGASVSILRQARPTMEDVFVSLTGRHLRDE